MALVGYECSDDSDISEDEQDVFHRNPEKLANSPTSVNKSVPLSTSIDNSTDEDSRLSSKSTSQDDDSDEDDTEDEEPIEVPFFKLRTPKSDTFNLNEIETKNVKSDLIKKLQPTQCLVRVPQLKKPITNQQGSGLLSILPNPISENDSSTELFSNKTPKINLQSSLKLLPRVLNQKKRTGQENDEDVDINVDFFSLSNVDPSENKFKDIDMSSLEMQFETPSKDLMPEKPSSRLNEKASESKDEDDDRNDNPLGSGFSQASLDEEAIKTLCGRKRKGHNLDDVQFIDVSEAEILAESKRNLAISLTEEVSRARRPGGVTTLSKRKHQITYLAFQARERELELKNQWAQNRFTKRQTQSKYGFI